MKKLTNKDVQALTRSGQVLKTVWSMIWIRKQMHLQDVCEKGYCETSAISAFNRLIQLGAVERVEGSRGVYRVSANVEK
jgi:hypothetical protein